MVIEIHWHSTVFEDVKYHERLCFMRLMLSNNLSCQDSPDIHRIIRDSGLIVHFQPVVSLTRKKVLGLEGLIRGIEPDTGQMIPPMALFSAARDENLTLELDRTCREKVLEKYGAIYEHRKDTLLFLNIDASILDRVAGSNYLLNQVKNHKINPGSIVIEVNEAKVQDNAALKKFISEYRKCGFLIALDDVGTGFSNLDRIPLTKPDIIKIDMSLIRNINADYHKQEVFKSLINLSNTIGALVVAEGVETKEEAIQVLYHGGHMIQGYYFSRPVEKYEESSVLNEKIEVLNDSFKEYTAIIAREEQKNYQRIKMVSDQEIMQLSNSSPREFDEKLSGIVRGNRIIECAYILDDQGIQVSETICYGKFKENVFFYLARLGADHSMKEYYYNLANEKLDRYLTEPYVSLATGNLCITYSGYFGSCENKRYILCIDFKTNGQRAGCGSTGF